MKMKEEFEALKQQRDTRKAREPAERSACLIAACPSACFNVISFLPAVLANSQSSFDCKIALPGI